MTVQQWPTDVNQNLEDGSYSEKPEPNLREFKPEVGPPKRARRSSIACALMSFTTVMTSAEVDTLLAFYRDDLKDGALTFYRTHPRTRFGGEFMFTAEPSVASLTRKHYRVSMAMRAMP